MAGRDLLEEHRVATPLELLFDVTFVVSFGLVASQYAHKLAEGHYGTALIGFGFAGYSICWAWANFSWFASAYDTDDWTFRLATMVQMIGVMILSLGVPRVFASIEAGTHVDASTMVLGYVVMRVALVFQWLRASRENPSRRRACLTYIVVVSIAQVGWLALMLLRFSIAGTIALSGVLTLVEVAAPVLAERKDGGTPWHAHHITERYGLFAIIALGEGVVGTVAVLSAVVEQQGWTLDAALVGIAGTGLTFGLWWIYFSVPSAPFLHSHRDRAFGWGYAQFLIVIAIIATGAGLHVAANFIERTAQIGPVATVLTVAIPVGIFLAAFYALHYYLVRQFDSFHAWALTATSAVIAVAVLAASSGINVAVCLVILMFAPAVTVVGCELRKQKQAASDMN